MRKKCLFQIVLVGVLSAGLLILGPQQVRADDTSQLKEQVQALQERVNQLESQLANKEQVMPMPPQPANGYFNPLEDPFARMERMRRQMDSNMRQAFANTGVAFNPKMDMKKTDKQYIITMDIPGMDKDKINVETKEGMLIISGERHSEIEDNKNNQYYRQERSFGSFLQAIPLPDDANKDQIDANYKNGVLTVTVERMKQGGQKSGSKKITVK